MNEYGLIKDPNYRDTDAQSAHEKLERVRTAEKLAYAARREERWLNEPFMIEKVAIKVKTTLNQIKQRILQKQY